MSLDVADVSTRVTATVIVTLEPQDEIPEMKVEYLDRMFLPDRVTIKYKFGPGQHRGWWVAQSVTVYGPRVLKPGPNGERRTGKDDHKSSWSDFRGDVQSSENLPEWLDRLISHMRPAGQVETFGGC